MIPSIGTEKMDICGNSVELVASLLLSVIVDEDDVEEVEEEEEEIEGEEREIDIVVCSDCPKSFLPFHVKSSPDVGECEMFHSDAFRFPANNVQNWEKDEGGGEGKGGNKGQETDCPSECLKKDPIRSFTTHGGELLEVRECEKKYSSVLL